MEIIRFPQGSRWTFQEIFVAATTDSFSICSEDFVLGMNKMIRCSVDICPDSKVPFFLGRFHDHTDPVPNDVFLELHQEFDASEKIGNRKPFEFGRRSYHLPGLSSCIPGRRERMSEAQHQQQENFDFGYESNWFWGIFLRHSNTSNDFGVNSNESIEQRVISWIGFSRMVETSRQKNIFRARYSTPLIAERNPTCNKYCWWFRVFQHHCCLKPCWWNNLSTYQIVHEFLHQQSEVIFSHLFITWREWLLKSSLPILAKL